MLKFIVNKDRVVLDKNILLIEEFTDILDYYKGIKTPELGEKVLLYIYLCCDMSEENFMKDLDYRQKPQQAKLRCFKDKDHKFTKKEEKLIDAGIDAYNFFNESAGERAEIVIDKKIDEIRSLIEETRIEIVQNVNPTTTAVSWESNEKIIANLAKQLESLLGLKLEIRTVAAKIKATNKIRGNKGSSLIERGVFRQQAESK